MLNFGCEAIHLRDVNMMTATDYEVFAFARSKKAILVSKDADFVEILEEKGPPPQLIWLTIGNTANANLQAVFKKHLPSALALLNSGSPIVEIQHRF